MFVVVIDPMLSIEQIVTYGKKEEYPWRMAKPLDDMLSKLKVISESTKIAIDAKGYIIYRESYGGGNLVEYEEILSLLTASTTF